MVTMNEYQKTKQSKLANFRKTKYFQVLSSKQNFTNCKKFKIGKFLYFSKTLQIKLSKIKHTDFEK